MSSVFCSAQSRGNVLSNGWDKVLQIDAIVSVCLRVRYKYKNYYYCRRRQCGSNKMESLFLTEAQPFFFSNRQQIFPIEKKVTIDLNYLEEQI